jgi:hypothetical protein
MLGTALLFTAEVERSPFSAVAFIPSASIPLALLQRMV